MSRKKAADAKLSKLAESTVNPQAASAGAQVEEGTSAKPSTRRKP
jgi:hypothetical protein